MHPIEISLLKNAFACLEKISTFSGGVICDIFVKSADHKIDSIQRQEGSDISTPEIHSIVFWKEGLEIMLVDPSDEKFSVNLIEDIRIVAKQFTFVKVSTGGYGIIYGHDGKTVGREINQSRDCIDIAVKIILELSYQTEHCKKIQDKMKNMLAQISTIGKYSSHFIKESNKQLREFRSTSSETRHLTLKVAKSMTGK